METVLIDIREPKGVIRCALCGQKWNVCARGLGVHRQDTKVKAIFRFSCRRIVTSTTWFWRIHCLYQEICKSSCDEALVHLPHSLWTTVFHRRKGVYIRYELKQ